MRFRVLTLLLVLSFVSFSFSGSLSLFATVNSIGITYKLSPRPLPSTAATPPAAPHRFCSVQYCTEDALCYDAANAYEVIVGKFVSSIVWMSRYAGTEISVIAYCPMEGGGIGAFRQSITMPAERQWPSSGRRELFVAPVGSPSCCGDCLNRANACSFASVMGILQSGDTVTLLDGTYDDSDGFDDGIEIETSDVIFSGDGDGSGVIIDASKQLDSLNPLGGGRYSQSLDVGSGGRYEDLDAVIMVHQSSGTKQRLLRYFDRTNFESLSFVSPVSGEKNWGFYLDAGAGEIEINIDTLSYAEYDFYYAQTVTDYFYVRESDVLFEKMTMKFGARGIRVREGNNIWIRNVVFDHLVRPIFLYRNSHRTLIEDCIFLDSRYIWQWEAVKENDPSGSWLEPGGICISTGFDSQQGIGVAARGLIVRRNNFRGWFDALNLSPTSPDLDKFDVPTNEIDAYENYITDCRDDGVEFDHLSSNIRFFTNRIERVLVGVSMAPSEIGPTYIFNNTIMNVIGWSAYKYQYGNPGWSGFMFIYHNLVWSNGSGAATSVGAYQWRKNVYRNNVLIGWSKAISLSINAHSPNHPVDMDYDALMCEGSSRCFRYVSNSYEELSDFVAATGLEKNAVLLTSTGGLFLDDCSFEPAAGSPLLGKGVKLKGFNSPPYDIGLVHDYSPPTAVVRYPAAIAAGATLAVSAAVGGVLLVLLVVLGAFCCGTCSSSKTKS